MPLMLIDSAGIGRTGAYIIIDALIGQIEKFGLLLSLPLRYIFSVILLHYITSVFATVSVKCQVCHGNLISKHNFVLDFV